jgi:DNA mismatch repair protein MutS2
VSAAREEAERVVEDLRAEVASTRRALERETVTATALDAAVARAELIAGRLPAATVPEVQAPAEPRRWKVGDRARSSTGGWEGRIAAIEKGGRRGTLEAGGMRVTVDVDDLVPAVGVATSVGGSRATGGSARAEADSNAAALRLARARSVASSLDLRGARVEEALEALDRYLDDASVAGLRSVTIIHGLGTGALRDAVRAAASAHPLVREARPGERGEGGDGATVVGL